MCRLDLLEIAYPFQSCLRVNFACFVREMPWQAVGYPVLTIVIWNSCSHESQRINLALGLFILYNHCRDWWSVSSSLWFRVLPYKDETFQYPDHRQALPVSGRIVFLGVRKRPTGVLNHSLPFVIYLDYDPTHSLSWCVSSDDGSQLLNTLMDKAVQLIYKSVFWFQCLQVFV